MDCIIPSRCLPVCTHSLKLFFFGLAGSNGVRVLRNASPIIPHCLARLLCHSQHVHSFINTCACMCKWYENVDRLFCVSWQLKCSFSSLVRGLQWRRSLCLHWHACILRDNRLGKGVKKCDFEYKSIRRPLYSNICNTWAFIYYFYGLVAYP